MTTKGNNQSQVNVRELALDILYEILEKDGYSHLVLNQALSKYQYLGNPIRKDSLYVVVICTMGDGEFQWSELCHVW